MMKVCSVLFVLVGFIAPVAGFACYDGFEHIAGLDPDKCYKLVLPGEGLYATDFFVVFNDALKECTLQGGFLVRSRTTDELDVLKDWLNANHASLFEDASGGVQPKGIWEGYQRRAFPVMPNETYDEHTRPQRIDPTKFYDIYADCPKIMMPTPLWRNHTQPDDHPNNPDPLVIDERCVAMKKITDPNIEGLDDYDCEEPIHHAIMCESCAPH